MTQTTSAGPKLTRKDFTSDQEVRWCPGCGDYAILAAVQGFLPELGIPREKIVFVSGIGCAARFPYYVNTYGIHTIHGRAPAIATGLATARPDLQVWVVTGDGDALSIGGNHFIHALRRNADIKILLFNNRIYGLTKGQYSPTSERGKITKSTPVGSLETPFNPVSLAIGAEATFVARAIDVDRKHLPQMLHRMAEHRGGAVLEILQNCVIYNDGAFVGLTGKEGKAHNRIYLEHGRPIRFGPQGQHGLVAGPNGSLRIEDVAAVGEDKLVVHDERRTDPSYAFALSRLAGDPAGPTALGVFRDVDAPVYGEGVEDQIRRAVDSSGPGDLNKLLFSGDTWTVR